MMVNARWSGSTLRLLVVLTAMTRLNACSLSMAAEPVAGSSPGQDYNALIAKAEAQGMVQVIVTLRMGYVPEGDLPSPQEITLQRARIAALQTAILQELGQARVASIKRYQFVPSLALEVSADALKILAHSEAVATITEDLAVPPLYAPLKKD